MKEKKALRLTLKRDAFDVMITGEKMLEFRKPSDWIMSRLFVNANPAQGLKPYDKVIFANGYGKSRPSFERRYNGCIRSTDSSQCVYSNGLVVNVEAGDIIIRLEM
ncbi:MAG: hypothetical protein ACRCUT_10920 [Spirochaetota bacterium]